MLEVVGNWGSCFGRSPRRQPAVAAGAKVEKLVEKVENEKQEQQASPTPAPPQADQDDDAQAAPAPSAGGTAPLPSAPPAPPPALQWVDSLPYCVAILSSNGHQLLYQSPGTDPLAAELWQSALSVRERINTPAKEQPSSILDSLLGAERVSNVFKALAQDRPWKGTIMHTRGGRPLDDQTAEQRDKSVCWVHTGGDTHENSCEGSRVLPLLSSKLSQSEGQRWEGSLKSQQKGAARSTSAPKPLSRSSLLISCRSEEDIDRLLGTSPRLNNEYNRTQTLLQGLTRANTHDKMVTPAHTSTSPTSSSKPSYLLSFGQASHAPEDGTSGKPLTSHTAASGPTGGSTRDVMASNSEIQADSRRPTDFTGSHHTSPFLLASTSECDGSLRQGCALSGMLGSSSPRELQSLCECKEPERGEWENTDAGAVPEEVLAVDVFISHLNSPTKEPPQESRDMPLVVVINNSSEHGRARAILSALAENQLELLSNIMPLHAIQFLALESRDAIPANIGLAHRHKDVTLLFMDICGFTAFSKSVEPVDVMVLLNNLFSAFDQLTDQCGVHKVETAGDCYVVSGGVLKSPQPSQGGFSTIIEESEAENPADSAKRVVEFAVKALETAGMVMMPGTKSTVRMRVGIHTGDCVSGLIGSKLPKFSCFGDAMDIASRMESTGVPERIHISETTYQLLQNEQWEWVPTGGVEVEGKGTVCTFLSPAPDPSRPPSLSTVPIPTDLAPCQYLKTACSLLQRVASPNSSSQPLPCMQIGKGD